MEAEITIYESMEFGKIRTMQDEKGEPWFVGRDVAEILGYKNPSNALTTHVDKEDKTSYLIQVSGTSYKANTCFINESGLYSLTLSSKLPQARGFKRWVTSEVLPQIRKTGGYLNVDDKDDDNTVLAKALLIAQRTIEMKNSQLEAQKPKVLFADALTASNDSILVRELAKLISQNGYEIGERRLYRWLRENGFLFKHSNEPMQQYVEKGLFEVHVTLVETHHGSIERFTTKVTTKGQKYFVELFMKKIA